MISVRAGDPFTRCDVGPGKAEESFGSSSCVHLSHLNIYVYIQVFIRRSYNSYGSTVAAEHLIDTFEP